MLLDCSLQPVFSKSKPSDCCFDMKKRKKNQYDLSNSCDLFLLITNFRKINLRSCFLEDTWKMRKIQHAVWACLQKGKTIENICSICLDLYKTCHQRLVDYCVFHSLCQKKLCKWGLAWRDTKMSLDPREKTHTHTHKKEFQARTLK